jgi:Mn-dependent DtxR family transcriptional regulator
MARRTTDEQMRVLRFIYDYIKSNDCAPVLREIAEALSVSTSVAYGRVGHLFVNGYLRETEPRQWRRNIALTEKGILACEGDE